MGRASTPEAEAERRAKISRTIREKGIGVRFSSEYQPGETSARFRDERGRFENRTVEFYAGYNVRGETIKDHYPRGEPLRVRVAWDPDIAPARAGRAAEQELNRDYKRTGKWYYRAGAV
jgi:hypothetical protein